MTALEVVKAVTPPALLRLLKRWSGRSLRFSGQPRDWAEALQQSTGYGAPTIVEDIAKATRAVIAGEAAYERDSVLFHTPAYPFPIIAALLRAAAMSSGRLEVVDLGGSLGTTYRQCRPFLDRLQRVLWRVVEQDAFVDVGRREFTTDELSFVASLDELPSAADDAVILASGVLQYLERPTEMLLQLAGLRASHLVIDRTSLSNERIDRLCIQRVPKRIYEADYPCWILSRSRLREQLEEHWRVVCEFPCADGASTTDDGLAFEFVGMILERKR